MANTGKKIVLSLKQRSDYDGSYTGVTKANDPQDPDFIPPSVDTTSCPITSTLSCPTGVFTGYPGYIRYEFSIMNSVAANTSVNKITITATGPNTISYTYISPATQNTYYTGDLSGAIAGSYNITITYLNSSDTVLATCNTASGIIAQDDDGSGGT